MKKRQPEVKVCSDRIGKKIPYASRLDDDTPRLANIMWSVTARFPKSEEPLVIDYGFRSRKDPDRHPQRKATNLVIRMMTGGIGIPFGDFDDLRHHHSRGEWYKSFESAAKRHGTSKSKLWKIVKENAPVVVFMPR